MTPLFDYTKHRLIMESSFEFKGNDFLYFDEGVPYYSLFRNSRKLNSFWELKYAAEVLWHLNREIDRSVFLELITTLSDRSSGHVVRTYSEKRVRLMVDDVMESTATPYVRRYRRIVFNPGKVITTEEKMSIVGELLGGSSKAKRVTAEKIYYAIESMLDSKERITYIKLAKMLICTRQTVSINITKDLKDILIYHNSHLLA